MSVNKKEHASAVRTGTYLGSKGANDHVNENGRVVELTIGYGEASS